MIMIPLAINVVNFFTGPSKFLELQEISMSLQPFILFYIDLLRSYISLLLPSSATLCSIVLLFILSVLPLYVSEELQPLDLGIILYSFLRATLILVTHEVTGQDDISEFILYIKEGSQEYPAFRRCADQALDDHGVYPRDSSAYFGTKYTSSHHHQAEINPDRIVA